MTSLEARVTLENVYWVGDEIYTLVDGSPYLVDTGAEVSMTRKSLKRKQHLTVQCANGFESAKGKAVAHTDLWKKIAELGMSIDLKVVHQRAHIKEGAHWRGNNEVDRFVQQRKIVFVGIEKWNKTPKGSWLGDDDLWCGLPEERPSHKPRKYTPTRAQLSRVGNPCPEARSTTHIAPAPTNS